MYLSIPFRIPATSYCFSDSASFSGLSIPFRIPELQRNLRRFFPHSFQFHSGFQSIKKARKIPALYVVVLLSIPFRIPDGSWCGGCFGRAFCFQFLSGFQLNLPPSPGFGKYTFNSFPDSRRFWPPSRPWCRAHLSIPFRIPEWRESLDR